MMVLLGMGVVLDSAEYSTAQVLVLTRLIIASWEPDKVISLLDGELM